jgi:hypothetical protein
MRQIGRTGTLILATLLVASAAGAQDAPASSPPNMPRWDVGATLGLFNTREAVSDRNLRYRSSGWENRTTLAYEFDAGYFWTQHVKADVGLTLLPEVDSYDFDTRPSPALPPGTTSYVGRTSRLTTLSTALTYQFFENAFVHPYVSGGVDLGWVRAHRTRDATTTTINRVRYTIPALDEVETSLTARPLVAVGCKSYFNSRTFVRSEARVVFGPDGVSRTAVRVGVGVDF